MHDKARDTRARLTRARKAFIAPKMHVRKNTAPSMSSAFCDFFALDLRPSILGKTTLRGGAFFYITAYFLLQAR